MHLPCAGPGLRMRPLPDLLVEQPKGRIEISDVLVVVFVSEREANIGNWLAIILAFETMETLFMDTASKAMTYVIENDSPYLQIYPDLGNLTNASRISKISVEDDLRAAKGHIVAAHLKEIVEGKYREIPYGTGDTHYETGIRELKKQGVALFTGEFWYVGNPDWKADLIFANAYLRKKIEA